jgi:RHS repeat-associated protein
MTPHEHTLPVVHAAHLAAPRPAERWMIESLWLRAAVGIIGGAPKTNKTYLALDLALSVASGTPALGAFAVSDPGQVLIYMAEDGQEAIKERLLGLCQHRALELASLPLHVITATTLRLDCASDRFRLENTMGMYHPRLLVLDPLVRLHAINENDAGEISRLLAYLRALQRSHNASIVLVHHTRKNGSGATRAGQTLRGSGDLHAWSDSSLYLRNAGEQLALLAEHRSAPAPEPLALALVSRGGDRLYTGQRWEWRARLYDYQARLYDPLVARFASLDPVREHSNPYAYGAWRPTALVDPTGRVFSPANLNFTAAGPNIWVGWSWDLMVADRMGRDPVGPSVDMGQSLSMTTPEGFSQALLSLLYGLGAPALLLAGLAEGVVTAAIGGVIGGLYGLATTGSLAGALSDAAAAAALGFQVGLVDARLFLVGQIVGNPSSVYTWLYNVHSLAVQGSALQALSELFLGGLRTVVPKYGYWGGGTWGSAQFGRSAPALNWVEIGSREHDDTLDNLTWAQTVLNPSTPGLPPGGFGAAYAFLGIPFFGASGVLQRVWQ